MKHFIFEEFFYSAEADAHGIKNVPDSDQEQLVRGNIMLLVDNVLDPIREHIEEVMFINSGFRCPRLNELVGGSKSSQHLIGQAADFSVPGMAPRDYKELAFWCAMNIDFDQMIVHSAKGFIHASYVSPERNRYEVLFT